MMSRDDNKPPAPEGTVQDYLDLLLTRATEQPEAQVDLPPAAERRAPIIAAARPVVSSKPLAEPRPLTLRFPLVEAPPAPEPVVPEPPVRAVEPAPVVPVPSPAAAEPEPVVETYSPAPARRLGREWLANGRPSWAQQRFECLLFKVGGLSLAVPLVELGTIHPITGQLTPLFGQIDWFMGLLSVKDANIRTVDTARVVMPERYQDTMTEGYRYVLSIDGVDWGLAVDSVSQPITLEPDQVKWRGSRSARPWLAGTVVAHMCALLDLGQLADMLSSNQRRA